MSWNETPPSRQPVTARARPAAAEPGFGPADFFVLRTPLLPFDELLAWSDGLGARSALDEDRRLLGARLQALVARPEVREALLVASPSLDESIPVWLASPDSERGRKVEHTLVRYFARMAGRPTPFGLFAGCSFGRLGVETRLAVAARVEYGRHTRLDMDYLSSLGEALCRHEGVRPHLTVRPSSSLYLAGGRMRYAEARLDGKARSYHLVAVELTHYLEATLARAANGARPSELARALLEDDPEIDLAEAERFIAELIDSQVLVAELEPAVTGPEPVHGMIAELRSHPDSAEAVLAADRLDEVRSALQALDARSLGAGEPPYRAIADRLRDLPAPVELSRLFQVDMTKPAPDATLGGAVVDEITRAVSLVHGLAARGNGDPLRSFRDAFMRRWEGREVPLVEALDEESGLGFSPGRSEATEAAPLLEGIALPPAAAPGTAVDATFGYLLQRLERNGGALELTLDADDVRALRQSEPPPLPDAFAVQVALAAGSDEALARGDFRVHLRGAAGPSGANLLGRFCHGLPELASSVRRYLAAEEALRPEAVFAEVVHLPEGRLGNVLLRPVLRSHEIPFLGASGAPRDRHIPVTDLAISVAGDRILLRSRRLGREVVPRLTTAHNYHNPQNLGIYRFLCALQAQGVANLRWSWGALEAAAFLPRVVLGKVVLSRARWRLDELQLRSLRSLAGEKLHVAAQALRAALRLPRHVALADADNLLPVDLDNALSVEVFVHLVRSRTGATVTEMAPGPDELCARGPEGRFVHELVIPYLRAPPASGPTDRSAVDTPRDPVGSGDVAWDAGANATGGVARSFLPGSGWLYAKLYTGTADADRVLTAVAPLVRGALSSGAAHTWFFIRYGDPDWHLRLRLHGDPARLVTEVLPALHAAVQPLLADGRIWKVQLDTYVRELERYGGDRGMLLCEQIFHADSEAALAILDALSGDEGADLRWRLALAGIDRLLDDFGFDLPARLALARRLRASYGRELRADVRLKTWLGEKYRKERGAIERFLGAGDRVGGDHPCAVGVAALAARSRAMAPLCAGLRALATERRLGVALDDLLASLIHMHANRLLHAAARAQELVLYDLLERLYTSRAARARERG